MEVDTVGTKIVIAGREATVDMTRILGESLEEDFAEGKAGRVSSVSLQVDVERAKVMVDIIGEVCEGRLMVRVFQQFAQAIHELQDDINVWISQNNISECKTSIVRSEGRIFVLVAGSVFVEGSTKE